MWLHVRIPGDPESEWIGTIEKATADETGWNISLVRRTTFGDPTDTAPFGKARSVAAMLDLIDKCSLVIPMVRDSTVSLGSPPERVGRISLAARCYGLLRGIAVDNYDKKMFSHVSFESRLFDVWEHGLSGSSPLKMNYGDSDRDRGEEFSDIEIPEIGTFKFHSVTGHKYQIPNAISIQRYYHVSVRFNEQRSIEYLTKIATGFELLMGLLVGCRPICPKFTVTTSEKESGELELGYLEHNKDDISNYFTAAHLRGIDGSGLPDILRIFYSNADEFRKIIYCIEKIRYFSTHVVDNFRLAMPVLEGYLRSRYKHEKQESFIQHKDAFLRLIDSCDDTMKNFCNKHVQIKDRKPSGLKTILRQAIDEVNSCGYEIGTDFADRINTRRGSLFHSSMEISEAEIIDVYEETLVIASILMLLAMRDLGLDIRSIAKRYNAFTDLRRVCGPRHIK